jgi:hemoglobin-like flavoprotein
VSESVNQLVNMGGRQSGIRNEVYQSPLVSANVRMTQNERLQVVVSHYTPPNFPLIPLISPEATALCRVSWKDIMEASVVEHGVTTTGVTLFYNEFYNRLDQVDTAGKFDAVLTRSISKGAMNIMAAKGAILLRIVKFVLEIETDCLEVQKKLTNLGKSHAGKGIRPYQYAIFVSLLVQTISSRLETNATNVVMEAWVNLLGFVTRGNEQPGYMILDI